MYNDLLEKVNKYDQQHLLKYYGELNDIDKQSLLCDINSLDFQLVSRVYDEINSEKILPKDITPMQAGDAEAFSQEEYDRYFTLGLKEIDLGHVAALTMCGGQGTRLGHNGPKGTYDIGLRSHKSLFEIQCDGLKTIGKGNIPWYLMTSNINHDDTVSFFEKNNYFGYPKENIFFFKQEMMAVLNKNGKILLENKGKILKSPNGNGGLFVSLKKAGGLDDMKNRGVKHIFICGIDNCLVKMADPLFVGYYLEKKAPVAAKSFMKRSAQEKAAIFCYSGGKPYVIEYTEIPDNLAGMQDENGKFVYGDTNVLNYIFDIDIIDNLCQYPMPYHVAVKKVSHLDTNSGEYVTIPDGLKFELFLFDYFTQIKDLSLLRINREEEFAPVKNLTGIDSSETAREMYIKVHEEER